MFWSRQVRRSMYLLLASVATLGGASASTRASGHPDVGVDGPTWYRSPSSIYALKVNPHHKYSQKGAVYSFSRKEKSKPEFLFLFSKQLKKLFRQ